VPIRVVFNQPYGTGGSMDIIGQLDRDLKDLSKDFTLEALADGFQPAIDAALREHKKDLQRESVLSPRLVTWLVLSLCLQRTLGYLNTLAWVLSGLRHRFTALEREPVTDGAIPRARNRLGVPVIRDLFRHTTREAADTVPDFHGLVSVIIDGSILTAPDTSENVVRWGKPTASVRRGTAGFPQVRLVALLVATSHMMLDAVIGASRGKGTGEVTVARDLILRSAREGLVFLLDRGFYALDFLAEILEHQAHFLVRVPAGAKLTPIRRSRRPDGSFLAWITNPKTKALQKVRVVRYQIPGFPGCRIVTSLLDEAISAEELVRHYHRRWEVELAFCSMKVRQSARKTGQCPTLLRSKLSNLVEQEVYALLTTFNLVRLLIRKAATAHGCDPLAISFTDALRVILEAVVEMRGARAELLPDIYRRLLRDIAACVMTRRRRPRVYPRVVKTQRSKFPLKLTFPGNSPGFL
jgi:hypothetical protein